MRNSKRIASVLALLLVVTMLAACAVPVTPAAAPAESAPAEEAAAEAPAIKIGLVTDTGGIDDRSFNQSAWEGVKAAAETLGLGEDDINYIQSNSPEDYADNLQQFLDADFNVIVTVGFALAEATVAAANENPDVFFIGVDQSQTDTIANLAGLVFHEDRAGYLGGILAGYMSQTGKIASVLGAEIPPVVAFATGFENGAKSVNPDIEVSTTYYPGDFGNAFNDPEWGSNTAKQALELGADFIFGAGGNTGNGAITGVAAAEGAGTTLFCLGVDQDQWDTVPAAQPCLISSAMKLITPGLAELIEEYAAGNMISGNFYGTTGLASFHDFEDIVPQEAKDAIAAAQTALEDGSLVTGYVP